MKPTEMRVTELLAAIQSPDPTPGGGSASALAGAVGASLVTMVATMPKHRAGTDAELAQLRSAGQRCAAIATRLATLVDEDSDAYERVIAAYRLPQATDDEKAERSSQIQAALRAAIETPLEVMRLCAAATDANAVVAGLGNPGASSDTAVARELLAAGLRGARLNVEINLNSVKDAGYADAVRAELNDLSSSVP